MRFRLHRSSLALLATIIAVLVASPRIVFPYEVSPRKKVHETLTLMASDCLLRAPLGARPSFCLPSPEVVMRNEVLKNADLNLGLGLGVVPAKALANAATWPDDPTGEVTAWTILKFGVKMRGQCEKYYSGGVNDGLLCSSHYGPLQFWHAMASSPEEASEETQRKMLAWAEFLYEVAVGDLDLTRKYCDYWRCPERKTELKGELAPILAPDTYFACTKDEKPWTISTLFSMKCTNFFSSKKCSESKDERVARRNALGALLHMVQDSFAQGHAARGSCETDAKTGRIVSKFECLPISQFYTYGEQDDVKHRQADLPPRPGISCASASSCVDDPILASAKVLWFVQQKKGAAELIEYLKYRVFPLADDHKSEAGAGLCFEK
jgi:hypothetical protein